MKHLCSLVFVLLIQLLGGNSVFALQIKGSKPLPVDTPEGAFSKYNSNSKMLKFSKYVEKPIPLKVWKDTSAYFYFSDTATKDRFRFSVIGDYEYSAAVYFQIISAKGVCIYKDSFPLLSILSMYFDGNGQYATRVQKENAISEYAQNLLSDYSLEGALEQLPARLEPDYTIHENHKLLSMNGADKFFFYSKKTDNNTFIGYDPILGYALIFYDTQY